MEYVLLSLLIILALCIVRESRNVVMIIYMCIASLVASMIYFTFGSPDVAMAEAAVGAFATIFFVICFEKHRDLKLPEARSPGKVSLRKFKKYLAPLGLSVLLFGLALYFVPYGEADTYLKDQYLSHFMYDIGGENAVTAIYLGYRVYDTLFEALVLIVSVVAVTHMSYSDDEMVQDGRHSDVERSINVNAVMHIIPSVILLFGVYLITHGHITAGGGFQGGLFIAAFFVCRYLVYNIFDLPIKSILRVEEFVFSITVVIVIIVIFLGALDTLPPIFQDIYMLVMNLLIGTKVGCGFIILFYRFIAIERR